MKYVAVLILGMTLFVSSAMAQAPQITDYSYNPGGAMRFTRLSSLASR